MITPAQVEQIHEASLALLADPGVRFEHQGVYDLLRRRGAAPGGGAMELRLPGEMVEEHVRLCPARCGLTDRQGREIVTGGGRSAMWSAPGLHWLERGEHRPVRRDDLARAARLLDRLDHVDVVFGMSMDDVPPPVRDVVGLNVVARNCAKHVRVFCFSGEGAEALKQIKPVVGGHGWLSIGFTAHGPLRWTNLALEVFARSAGAGIAVSINGEPMAGTSGPVTLAGAAAVGNAEILAGVVVNQALEPGRPCIYNLGLAHVFDMKHAVAVTGGPENALFAQLSAAMGRFYRLPSASWVCTESLGSDAQAGLEKMFNFHTHLDAGVDHIWGVGNLESEMTFSPAQAVIDDEMIAYCRRFQRGVGVSEDALAVAVVRDVGVAGSFLDHEHTLQGHRGELFQPSLLFRGHRANWQAEGSLSLERRAEGIAGRLMDQPAVSGLDEHQVKALESITDRVVRTTVGGAGAGSR